MIDIGKLLELVAAMNREGVEYVVFGAIALGATLGTSSRRWST